MNDSRLVFFNHPSPLTTPTHPFWLHFTLFLLLPCFIHVDRTGNRCRPLSRALARAKVNLFSAAMRVVGVMEDMDAFYEDLSSAWPTGMQSVAASAAAAVVAGSSDEAAAAALQAS